MTLLSSSTVSCWCTFGTFVRRSLSRINARKAPGPDNIPGCVLRDCATHWCLHRHFQHLTKPGCCPHMLQSYHHHSSPEEVISILLQWLPSSSTHSYSHEVLWTASHATHQTTSVLPPSLDPFQFAYRSNRSTDDAIATALHPALTHLDKTDTYVRLLFIDFSSAFNTIIPQQLIHKLVQLGLNTSLCNWLLDFLTGRPQTVRVGSNTSSTITLNTGVPPRMCAEPPPLHSADPRLHTVTQLQPLH